MARLGREWVLVVGVAGAPAPSRRRLRRPKPQHSDPQAEQPAVPVTTLTAIRPEDLGEDEEAHRWLERLREDHDAAAAELDAALTVINRAVHAQRTASLDPHLPDVSAEHALVVRLGYGEGEALVDGRFSDAIELPRGERRRRLEALRPQERVAAVLSGREEVSPCELPILRARADVDSGRSREAALQLRVGLEAMLAEPQALAAPGQEDDFAALDARRRVTGEAANEALSGALSPERLTELTETLRLCERILRRHRAHG